MNAGGHPAVQQHGVPEADEANTQAATPKPATAKAFFCEADRPVDRAVYLLISTWGQKILWGHGEG